MTPSKAPSSSQIVPTHYQHLLMQDGHQGDLSSWRTGDIAVDLADKLLVSKEGDRRRFLAHKGEAYPANILWKAMAQFAGVSWRNIQDRERYSRLVPPDIREEFPALSRSHHKTIADYAKGDAKQHAILCGEALTLADEYGGQIPSVDVLGAHLRRKNGPPPAWESKLRAVVRLLEWLCDSDAPEAIKAAAAKFLRAVG